MSQTYVMDLDLDLSLPYHHWLDGSSLPLYCEVVTTYEQGDGLLRDRGRICTLGSAGERGTVLALAPTRATFSRDRMTKGKRLPYDNETNVPFTFRVLVGTARSQTRNSQSALALTPELTEVHQSRRGRDLP